MTQKLCFKDYELRVLEKDNFDEFRSKSATHNPQSQTVNPKFGTGFTLIEVIVAITIGTVVIVASTVALRIGLSHLENGEEWLNDSVREATAYDFFWQQVSSIRSIEIPKPAHLLSRFGDEESDSGRQENKKIYFKGSFDSMSFITPLSLNHHYGYGLVVATYSQKDSYDGVELVYKERRLNPAVLSSFSDNIFSLEDEKKEVVFFEKCDDIEFEYLRASENATFFNSDTLSNFNAGDSYKEWVGTIENRLPAAIKIIIRKKEEEKELVAPVMVMYSL